MKSISSSTKENSFSTAWANSSFTFKKYFFYQFKNKKFEKLTHLLDSLAFNQTIIFVNRVDRAKKLTELLNKKLFNPICIHSLLKQEERIKNYDSFKANNSRLLVATDLFGRGIDIERVNLVINYGNFINNKQTSHKTEIHISTESAEQEDSEQRVLPSTLLSQMKKLVKTADKVKRLISKFFWKFKKVSKLRFPNFQMSLIPHCTCDQIKSLYLK